MATAVMRNRVSTEFRKVEKDSDDYLELQAQRDPNDGRPVWEETGIHDAVEQSRRLENDAAQPWDVGDAEQPVATIAGAAAGYTSSSEFNEPLPAEVEAGAEQEGNALFGVSSPPAVEVPLTGSMEDPTDTETPGTDEDIAETVREAKKSGKSDRASWKGGKSDSDQTGEGSTDDPSGQGGKSGKRKKPSEGGAPSPTGGETE